MKKPLILTLLIFTLNAAQIAEIPTSSGSFNEDAYILEALDALDNNDDKKALEAYKILYQNTKKPEYLKEQIFAQMRLGNEKEALNLINEFEKVIPNNLEILKAKAFLLKNDIDATLEIYKVIVKLEDNDSNNVVLANLYTIKNDLQNAKKHLLRAYQLNSQEGILLLIASIDLKNNTWESSLSLIKSHFESEMSEQFANSLLEVGANFDSIKELESLYLYYFDKSKTTINAKNLAKLYFFTNDIDKITALSQEFGVGYDFLIDIYITKKDYKNARITAKKALEITGKKHYLGVLAIIDFEDTNSDEEKRQIAPKVTRNLATALSDEPNHIFYNYLGYLLIDYDIDVKNGVEYVKKALEYLPDNPAYLDSLAWGYYKLQQCELAKDTMDKIPEEIKRQEAEIKEHLDAINKCLKK